MVYDQVYGIHTKKIESLINKKELNEYKLFLFFAV